MKPVADNELNPSCQCSDITLKKKNTQNMNITTYQKLHESH